MGTGIRAEIRVDSDGTCPVVEAVSSVDAPSYSIARTITGSVDDRVTEEFMLTSGKNPQASIDLTEVFDYGSKAMYRFTRELGRGCPCEAVEQFDCPIIDLHANNDSLYLVFHAADMETLQEVISHLRAEYPTIDVRRLLRSEHDQQDNQLIFLDRSQLTERQREVLEKAHTMGYFDHPKGANAGEVAAALDISTSTFSEHLSAAQSKLLDAILDV